MSNYRLYLSLIPEALIASMLEPKEFGSYYAVGKKVHVFGEAMFFEVDPAFRSDDFPFHLADERCITQPNGDPKSSVYLGIHDVLARIPVSALGNLYLVTDDGRTLGLERAVLHARARAAAPPLSGVLPGDADGGEPTRAHGPSATRSPIRASRFMCPGSSSPS
jgi:hypothetical protein